MPKVSVLMLGALAALDILTISLVASACKCAGPSSPAAAVAKADAAFWGLVTATYNEAGDAKGSPVRFEIRVERVFRGKVARMVEVQQGNTSCGFRELTKGDSWLIVARVDEGGVLHTRKCTGTMSLAPAGKKMSKTSRRVLRSLGPGSEPVADKAS